MWVNTQSDIISKVLSPAVRLFLRSQVERLEDLEIQIQGHDRQILRGYLPSVRLGVQEAIYQGLHLGPVQLQGENIRLNIGQVLRGKPLQILEPIRISGEARVNEDDLNDSIASLLLSQAFTDLLILFLSSHGLSSQQKRLTGDRLRWENVSLHEGYFTLTGRLDAETSIALGADLKLADARTLMIVPRYLQGLPEWSAPRLQPFTVDLGTDVEIQAFVLVDRTISCQGQLLIRP
jgi:hypothetical protein